jgi:hypothetical protein
MRQLILTVSRRTPAFTAAGYNDGPTTNEGKDENEYAESVEPKAEELGAEGNAKD